MGGPSGSCGAEKGLLQSLSIFPDRATARMKTIIFEPVYRFRIIDSGWISESTGIFGRIRLVGMTVTRQAGWWLFDGRPCNLC